MIKHAVHENEIISVISSTLKVENHFTIWQRDKVGNLLFQIKGTLISLSRDGHLSFKLDQSNIDCLNFDIYFAAEKASVVYKCKKINIEDDYLHCNIPAEVKYMERRKHKRRKMKKKELKEVEVLCKLKPEFADKEARKKLISRFIDISDSGACFYLTKESIDMIDIEDKIYLTSLCHDIKLDQEKAVVVNIRKVKRMTMSLEEMYAVGVMFI